MTFFTKNRLLNWGVLLLIIVNLGGLGALGWQFLGPSPAPEPAHRFLQEELKLTDVQAQKVDDLRRRYQGKMKIVEDEIGPLKEAIMESVFLSPIDTENVEQLAKEIGEKQAELEYLRFLHVLELKSLFQPEQTEKFQAIIRDVLRPKTSPRPAEQPKR
ncbi:MAG: periplasmic heavy metal sensor [Desulfuromusa sp.]|nr:periplasmic heavy metal sensor [Desulfuromusa sp.]